MILSPGGYDASLFFAGNDRPGVVVADQAERAAPVAGPRPFRRALLFGGGPRAAEMLRRFGESVEAVASFGAIDPEVTLRASELGIPLYPRTILLRAHGRARVRSVRLRSRGGETTFSLSVDAVVLAHRRLPNAQLFFQLGARMHWEPSIGHYLPDLTDTLETTVPGLFAAGEAAGFPPDGTAAESGSAAANAAAGRPGAPAPPRPPSRSVRVHELEAYLPGVPPVPTVLEQVHRVPLRGCPDGRGRGGPSSRVPWDRGRSSGSPVPGPVSARVGTASPTPCSCSLSWKDARRARWVTSPNGLPSCPPPSPRWPPSPRRSVHDATSTRGVPRS